MRKPAVPGDPQDVTLSVRLGRQLYSKIHSVCRLESLRRGVHVTTSEVAKLLLDSAREDRLEIVELLTRPTESLQRVRCKVASGQPLSRAEWTLIVFYARVGVRTHSKNPVSRASYIGILEAFQAVYELRAGSSSHDEYYLSNLPCECRPKGHQVSDPATPEVVRQTMAETLRWVRDPAAPCIPTLAIRNLYLFLEEEKLSEAVRLNETLAPYWPVLWRVAARGHYLEKGEPVREVPKKPTKSEESAQPENPGNLGTDGTFPVTPRSRTSVGVHPAPVWGMWGRTGNVGTDGAFPPRPRVTSAGVAFGAG